MTKHFAPLQKTQGDIVNVYVLESGACVCVFVCLFVVMNESSVLAKRHLRLRLNAAGIHV